MKVAHSEQDLVNHTCCISFCETKPLLADLREDLEKIAMGNQLKRDIIVLTIFTEVQHAAHVRMRNLFHDFQFLLHEVDIGLLLRQFLLRYDFKRDGLVSF